MSALEDFQYRDLDAYASAHGINSVNDMPAGGGELFRASKERMRSIVNTTAMERLRTPYEDERISQLPKITGRDPEFYKSIGVHKAIGIEARRLIKRGDVVRTETGEWESKTGYAKRYLDSNKETFDAVHDLDMAVAGGQVMSDDQIMGKVREDAQRIERETRLVSSRGRGAGAALADMAGAVVGSFYDPVMLGTLPIGGPIVGRGIFGNALRAFGTEALIAGGVQAGVETAAVLRNRDLGVEYTAREAAYNTLATALGAGVIRAAGSVTVDVAGQALSKYRAARQTSPGIVSRETEDAADVVQDFVDTGRHTPDGIPVQDQFDNVRIAHLDLESDRPVTVTAAVPAERATPEDLAKFYDENIVGKARGDIVQNKLFVIGRADTDVAGKLSRVMPDYGDATADFRISGRSLKHIEEEHPSIARDLISSLPEIVARPDEVLPSPRGRDRALLVKHDWSPEKHAVAVVEVAKNGSATDIVTVHTSPERTLKKAREMARQEGQRRPTESGNSPHPQPGGAGAAADFPTVSRAGESIAPTAPEPKGIIGRAIQAGKRLITGENPDSVPDAAAAVRAEADAFNPERAAQDISKAEQLLKDKDIVIPDEIKLRDGAEQVTTKSGREAMKELDKQADGYEAVRKCSFPED